MFMTYPLRADLVTARAPRGRRALFGSSVASALGVAGLLIPKRPLCLAAYLCVFGVSASSARSVAWLGVPLCIALIAASALATAVFVAQRGRRLASQKSGTCCTRH
jgi:hypothetical protein